jgi:uncharacterized protein (TIGR02147 family)
MVNLFDYSDFRKYLNDYYMAKKKENPNFSYQFIANKAGFKNKGFVYNIINGDKVLSKSNIFKLSQALGHNKYEVEYFENLVCFNQAENLAERNFLFEKMGHIKNKGKATSAAQIARKDQFEFYSKWYHAMIRSIIDMYKFTDDYKWLAKMINPSISVNQAKQSVQLLEKLGLICKEKNGVFKVCNKSLTTGKEIVNLAVQNFHNECTDLAKRSIQEFPTENRNITGLTLGISEKNYKRICEEIQEFQLKIMEIANTDQDANRVFQLNFHLFPTSNQDIERQKK